ncbi:MAG: mandelate racemase/muconate lactonizing enzyme family protein [Burkholderiales bacterium]
MKITSVDIYHVEATWRRGWNPVILRIRTDEGIDGLGEAGTAVGGGHNAYVGMLKDLAQMHLIGANPLNAEKIWETLLRKTWLAQGNGLVVFAGISAIDQALWDIKGKAAKLPVYQMLGGKSRESLRAYASQIHFGWPADYANPAVHPAQLAEAALKAVADGFDAVKIDPITYDEKGGRGGWDMTGRIGNDRLVLIYNRVKAIRDAVGPNVDIILETHAQPGVTSAIQIGRVMEGLNCMYYEEPVSAQSVDGMAKVAQSVKIPIAAGEHLATRWGFRPYFEKQILNVIQPDICVAGGISECKKIADMAHTYDVSLQGHCCGSPVTLAATLHLETVIPNFIIHEYVGTTSAPGNRALVNEDLVIERGRFKVPDGPGLGITLNEKEIAKYAHVEVA